MANSQNQTIGAPYKNIIDTAAASGLSQSYLRKGCKDGSIPHIRIGSKYMINIPALYDQLGIPYEPVRL